MADFTQKSRQIAIGTPLGDDKLLLRSFSFNEALGRMFHIQAEVLSEDAGIDFDKIIGQNVTIRLNVRNDATRYFNGCVASFKMVSNLDRFARYQAVIVPNLWFLTRTSNCRIFQDKSVPDIIKDVLKERGVGDIEESLSASYLPWEYCVQYRETDFNFVSRLMEQEGIYYYFKHDNGKHTIVLTDDASSHKPLLDYESIDYRTEVQSDSGGECLSDWVIRRELQAVDYVLKDFDFKKPATDLSVHAGMARKHTAADFEMFDYPGEYDERSEGDRYSKVRLQELQSQFEVGQASGDVRGISAGFTFELENHPRADQNRKYLATAVQYVIESEEFDTSGGATAGFHCTCQVSAIPADAQFRSSRTTIKPLIQGPQTAIVVGPDGEEIYTDEHGRVKLKFHWDRYSKADQDSSCWIRVAQLWAGKKWGAMYLPRIGQEVIVEFLDGDPDQPIITGRVYNGDAPPPYPLPDEKTKSTLKSNSSKGGAGFNELRFEDKKGEEQIFIHSQHNMDVRVRNSLRETVYGNREIRVGWEKDGATGGSLNTLVKLDANTHVKAGEYRKVDKDVNVTVDGAVVEHFAKDHATQIDTKRILNAKEVVIEAGDAISEKTAKMSIQTSDEFGIKAGTLNVESTSGISLKCGGNFVTIDASGVSIKGAMVNINSGGSGQSASAAKSAELPDMETPLEAAVADDGKTGAKTKGLAGPPRTRKKVHLTPIKAPPWVPPPPPKKESIESNVCQPVSNKPCGIKALEIKCKHANRAPGPSNVLQIVAEPTKKEKKAFEGPIKIEGEVEYGGEDEISSKVTTIQGDSSGKKSLFWSNSSAQPEASQWVQKGENKYKVEAPEANDRFPINARPQVFYAHGKGCDDCAQMITIESFPSQKYSVSVSLEFFKEWSDKINHAWEEWGKKVFELSPVELKPKLDPPQGSLKANWGWKEDKDWRAYFELAVKVGLDPIIGIGIEIEVSALKLVGAAFGVPPVISDLGSQHLLDILLIGGASAKASLMGGPVAKFYATGEEKIQGDASLSGTGSVEVKLTARAGSKYVFQASWTGSGKIEFKPEGKLTLKREGLFLSSKGELDPLVLGYKIETRMFYFFSKSKEDTWKVWETITLWETEPHRLIGSET
jgi:type VI secretion system secreted protein VgrG